MRKFLLSVALLFVFLFLAAPQKAQAHGRDVFFVNGRAVFFGHGFDPFFRTTTVVNGNRVLFINQPTNAALLYGSSFNGNVVGYGRPALQFVGNDAFGRPLFADGFGNVFVGR